MYFHPTIPYEFNIIYIIYILYTRQTAYADIPSIYWNTAFKPSIPYVLDTCSHPFIRTYVFQKMSGPQSFESTTQLLPSVRYIDTDTPYAIYTQQYRTTQPRSTRTTNIWVYRYYYYYNCYYYFCYYNYNKNVNNNATHNIIIYYNNIHLKYSVLPIRIKCLQINFDNLLAIPSRLQQTSEDYFKRFHDLSFGSFGITYTPVAPCLIVSTALHPSATVERGPVVDSRGRTDVRDNSPVPSALCDAEPSTRLLAVTNWQKVARTRTGGAATNTASPSRHYVNQLSAAAAATKRNSGNSPYQNSGCKFIQTYRNRLRAPQLQMESSRRLCDRYPLTLLLTCFK